jgi:hypothetical protein
MSRLLGPRGASGPPNQFFVFVKLTTNKVMKISRLLPALLLLGTFACTKPRAGYSNRPIYSSADIETASATTDYAGNGPDARRRKLIFKTPDEQRIVLDPGQVWGYETRSGHRYRYVDGKYYRLEELAPIAIYSRTYTGMTGAIPQPQTDYFFSRTPSSLLLPLQKRSLRVAFADDPTFVQFINTRRLRVFNRKTKRFFLNEWYEELPRR